MKKDKGRLSTTRLAGIYYKMFYRCNNPKDRRYKNYGGRGISICDEWNDEDKGFFSFYEWAMNNGYSDTLTLDRIDVNGNYEPSNCRWITNAEQQKNKTVNHYLDFNGQKTILTDAAKELGISANALAHRLKVSDDNSFIYHRGIHHNWKSVVRYGGNGERVVFKSILEAAEASGVASGNIVKVCKGERSQTGGYVFRYVKEDL